VGVELLRNFFLIMLGYVNIIYGLCVWINDGHFVLMAGRIRSRAVLSLVKRVLFRWEQMEPTFRF